LTEDGEVWSWGANWHGQLGIGQLPVWDPDLEVLEGPESSPTPVPVLDPSGEQPLAGVKAIAAGDSHSLALTEDGEVWSWGGNGYGQLGIGQLPVWNPDLEVSEGPESSPTPVPVLDSAGEQPLTGVKAIAAGNSHSLALTAGGVVYAWGAAWDGQLGNGATEDSSPSPVEVTGLTGVKAIAAGDSHSLTLTGDGAVYAWGGGYSGQLGSADVVPWRATPSEVTGLVLTGQLETVAPGTPSISGNARVGAELAADPGTWLPDGVQFAYQWLRDAAPISGATGQTYTLTADDAGSQVAVRVTGALEDHSPASVTSAVVTVQPGQFTFGTPQINGNPQVGAELTAAAGTWAPAGA
jgi:hypothetical protein